MIIIHDVWWGSRCIRWGRAAVRCHPVVLAPLQTRRARWRRQQTSCLVCLWAKIKFPPADAPAVTDVLRLRRAFAAAAVPFSVNFEPKQNNTGISLRLRLSAVEEFQELDGSLPARPFGNRRWCLKSGASPESSQRCLLPGGGNAGGSV